jgi:hypothetical protein
MGDRCVCIFKATGTYGKAKGKTFYSPGIYLHWMGAPDAVQELLEKAAPYLRKGDNCYSAARFCGVCHAEIPGNLGLGIFDPPEDKKLFLKKNWAALAEHYCCDNGIYFVDTDNGDVIQVPYGGKGKKLFTIDFPGKDSYE